MLFGSCSSYLLGRALGSSTARESMLACASSGKGDIPGCLTLAHLREVDDVSLCLDSGATHIGKTRSRHFTAALRSGADAWVTVDDDVCVDGPTVRNLVAAVSRPEPTVCIVPCLLRERNVVNVEWSPIYSTRKVGDALVRRAVRGGFGCVAVNRSALDLIADIAPWFVDDDGARKCAPFLEVLVDGRWLGEDLAFFGRLDGSSVAVEGLVTGTSEHSGAALNLREANT